MSRRNGREIAFTYEGRAFPAFTGQRFESIAQFCHMAGISRTLVYQRRHEGWSLTKAIDVPRLDARNARGSVYKITRLSNGQLYVGLTITTLNARWRAHVRQSVTRRTSPLARAILADGPDGFQIDLIERDLPPEQMQERERAWIAELDTIFPMGLNRHSGGALGGGGGRELEFEGETFPTVASAARDLARRYQITEAAVIQRLSKGMSLEAPLKVRRTRGVAGTYLWSRWRAMRANGKKAGHGVDPTWLDWDRFVADIGDLQRTQRLERRDKSKDWGPSNFSIRDGVFIDHPRVGSLHWTRWRSLMKSADAPHGRGVIEEWRDFNAFERDISAGYYKGAVIIPLVWNEPWGPSNFRWGTKADRSALSGLYGRKHVKHGAYRTPVYKRWQSMQNDCRRNGTGITDEWLDFERFRADVEVGVEQGLTLVRPDRNEPWGPSNFQLLTIEAANASRGRFTHRQTGTPLHNRWSSLVANARINGVSVVPAWLDFGTFAKDVGVDRPGHKLERPHRSLGWGPDNFAWVNLAARRARIEDRRTERRRAAQLVRDERVVHVEGRSYRGLYALAAAYGLPASTVCFRVRKGMSPSESVLTPKGFGAPPPKPTVVDGIEFASFKKAAKHIEQSYGIRPNTLLQRLNSGMDLQAAAEKPLRGHRRKAQAL